MLIWKNGSPEISIKEKKAKCETVYREPVCTCKSCVCEREREGEFAYILKHLVKEEHSCFSAFHSQCFTCDIRCVWASSTPTNSVAPAGCPTILTQFWHCPPGISFRSRKLRVQSQDCPHFRCQLEVQLSPVLPVSSKLEVPTTPSIGSKLLEWFTVHLVDYGFLIKVYNSGAARWERCVGRGVGEGREASLSHSSKPPCVHQPGSSPDHLG